MLSARFKPWHVPLFLTKYAWLSARKRPLLVHFEVTLRCNARASATSSQPNCRCRWHIALTFIESRFCKTYCEHMASAAIPADGTSVSDLTAGHAQSVQLSERHDHLLRTVDR